MTKSVVVLLAAIIIYIFPRALIIDPLCTCVFAVIVFAITIKIFRECLLILMEAPPPNFNVMLFTAAVLDLEYVIEIHDIHIWMLTSNHTCLTAHIVATDSTEALIEVTNLAESYGITHSTF